MEELSREGARSTAEQELMLYRRCKSLFITSRQSAGARTLVKLLCKEGFQVGICRVKSLMVKLGLVVKQRVAYKVTTMRKHSHLVFVIYYSPMVDYLVQYILRNIGNRLS